MNTKNYRLFKTSGFPLASNPKQSPSLNSKTIQTYGLLPPSQPDSYEIHSQAKDVFFFNEYEYIEREFTKVIPIKEEHHIFQNIKLNVQKNTHNLFMFPILETDQAKRLTFPRNQKGSSSILKEMVQGMVDKKQMNTVITLSILGIQSNGNLVDELNFQWLEEQENKSEKISELASHLSKKEKIKINKLGQQEIKIFQLNRQQICDWEEAQDIFQHYYQVSDYLETWSEKRGPRMHGYIYHLSEVEINLEDGSIIESRKKNILIHMNQFVKGSNLMLTRIGQSLCERVHDKAPINTRDYSLMLFLSECFEKESPFHFTIFSQLGRADTLSQQNKNLSFNLQFPGKYSYLKNYCDKDKIIERVKRLGIRYNPLTMEERKKMSTKKAKSNFQLLQESQKVTSKLFYYETQSSSKKRRSFKVELDEDQDEKPEEIHEIYGMVKKK